MLDARVVAAASWLALVPACGGPVYCAARPSDPGTLVPVGTDALKVTSGAVAPMMDCELAIRSASVRAVAERRRPDSAQLSFLYRGPSAAVVPLASGELRRQIGLKLRAQDTCNLIYVMWHIEPTTGIHVAVKANPGMTTHEQCADGGYRTLEPTWVRDVPSAIDTTARRTLDAAIENGVLRVLVDAEPVWIGPLPPDALAMEGPVGLRSDNGDFDVVLRAPSQ